MSTKELLRRFKVKAEARHDDIIILDVESRGHLIAALERAEKMEAALKEIQDPLETAVRFVTATPHDAAFFGRLLNAQKLVREALTPEGHEGKGADGL